MLLALLIISTISKGLVGKSELLVSNFVELSISISFKYDYSAIKKVDLKFINEIKKINIFADFDKCRFNLKFILINFKIN